KPMPPLFSWPLLIAFLIITWIFFRAPSFAAATHIFMAMAGQGIGEPINGLATIALAAAVALIGPSSQKFVEGLRPLRWLTPLAAVSTVAILFKLNGSPAYEFIYFHF